MINGYFTQWIDEVQQHGQHALAAAAYLKQVVPWGELLKLGAIAIVTAVLTSNVTIAKLEAEQASSHRIREMQIKNRDAQIQRMDERDARMEERLNQIAADVAALKAVHK